MVWGLFPIDPLSGEDKYYIFSRGSYKVGRKGCDVIINKDKGVSRIHAEIFVDEMISLNPLQRDSSNINSKVRIRDCSKYGTFINKTGVSKEKLHEFPGKEKTLKDGDLISFGTGSATYRFSYAPLLLFVYRSDIMQVNASIQEKVSSIGACLTSNFCMECTHVLVHSQMPVTEDLLDAILAKKPLVTDSWLESVAEKSICTEFPSCNFSVMTLMVEGVPIELANSENRKNCLEAYTFLLESTDKYKYGYRLPSLLEVCGSKTLCIERFCSTSQDLEHGDHHRVVFVIPRKSKDESSCFHKLSSLPRVDEMDLIYAVLSGHLDPSILTSPSVIISSSCSTDETVVADSDVEAETSSLVNATSTATTREAPKYPSKDEISVNYANNSISGSMEKADVVLTEEAPKYLTKGEISISHASPCMTGSRKKADEADAPGVNKEAPKYLKKEEISINHANNSMTLCREKAAESECEHSVVIYSQDLVVRDLNLSATVSSTANNGVINFKCFRKINTQSGNSFSCLIPFSKYPYKESNYETEEMVESVKEEKKRKQLEAIAEDLFNNERGRKRGVAGTLHGLLAQ